MQLLRDDSMTGLLRHGTKRKELARYQQRMRQLEAMIHRFDLSYAISEFPAGGHIAPAIIQCMPTYVRNDNGSTH